MEEKDREMEGVSPQLLKALASLFDKKLSVLASKEDFQVLNAEMDAIKTENVRLKEEINVLKLESEVREDRITTLEINARKGNLILRGLKNSNDLQSNPTLVVTDFFKEFLGLHLENADIHVYAPGRKSNSPQALLVVTFGRDQDKWKVLNAAKKLKGTGFFIHPDFPPMVRKRRQKLLLVKKELLRVNSSLKVTVQSDKLFVNDCKFMWRDGTGLHSTDKNCDKVLSVLAKKELEPFIKMLVEDRLPRDYFHSKDSFHAASS